MEQDFIDSVLSSGDDVLTVGSREELVTILTSLKQEKPISRQHEDYNTFITKLESRVAEMEKLEYSGSDQYEKYVCDANSVVDMLERYGVAIISKVLNDEECDNIVNGMWDYLEHVTSEMDTPMNRADSTTWSSFYDLFLLHSMLMQHWQVGHAQFVWDVRQNVKMVDIFARIWNVNRDELLVSFDGVAFHLPPEVTKRGHFRGKEWLHCDQSFKNSEFLCVQSWVTGLEVRPGDATLTFLEGSNSYHKEFGRAFGLRDSSDWYKLTETDVKWYQERGCRNMNITCPRGSLVLWDSRTIHAGKEALKFRQQPNFRCVVYLCYTPQSLISNANRKKKLKALQELRLTSHWPHKVKLFPVLPRTYGKAVPIVKSISPPILNDLGQRLAGKE